MSSVATMRAALSVTLSLFITSLILYKYYSNEQNSFDRENILLLDKDISLWSPEQLEIFMKQRDNIYKSRREKIRRKCLSHPV